MQYVNRCQSPIGKILLAADDTGLTGLWFVIWVFRLLIVIYFGKFMIYAISTLYRKRKKSVINHISFISIYSCVYAFSFIISFMKFFSLFFLIGFYVKKGNYLNLF